MGQQHTDTAYKMVELEYINTDRTIRKSVRRIRFRINGIDEYTDINRDIKNYQVSENSYWVNSADEYLIRELERLLNKVLAR